MRLGEIYQEFKDRLQFVCVYVREAHPSDGWASKNNAEAGIDFNQPTSPDERATVAKAMINAVDFAMPVILDEISNKFAERYGALPNRLYLLNEEGRIVYGGGIGPHAYDPEAWLEAIKEYIA